MVDIKSLPVVMRAISTVKPYQKNTKKHDQKQIANVAQSIKDFGFVQPLVVDKDGVVIIGHCRLEAAKSLGMQEVPCVIADTLSDAEANALRIVDNKSNESPWDLDFLADELMHIDLSDYDFDFGDLSINDDEPAEAQEIAEDEAPAVQDKDAVEQYIKPGDIFILGRHRLMCGDSTNPDAVARLMDGKKADLALTDPPYGISIVHDYDGKIGQSCLATTRSYPQIKGDESTDTAKANFAILKDISKEQIIFGGNFFTDFLVPSPCWLIWDKRGDMPSNNFSDAELAWTSFATRVQLYTQVWSGMIREGDRSVEGEHRVHPTQKPVGLLASILRDYTNDGALIVDCFGGSGSTLIACEKTGRTCYMMEYEPQYIDVIIRRWEAVSGGKAVKEGSDT